MNTHAEPRLIVLPVQVIETDTGVLLRRGTVQVRLTGRGVYEMLHQLLGALEPPGATRGALLRGLAGPQRAAAGALLDMLARRRMVVPEGTPAGAEPSADPAEEVFFWDFGLSAIEMRRSFRDRAIDIVGVNRVGLALVRALEEAGFTRLSLVDAPVFRNLGLAADPRALPEPAWAARAERPQTLVVTAEFGGKALLRPWNAWAVANGVEFFPVVLQSLFGSVGPYVVPGETPCTECLRGRENSNIDDPASLRRFEAHAFEGQLASGHHPLMPRMVADMAAFELVKVLSGIGRGPIGRLVTINPLDSETTVSRVLRLPFCPCCGTAARHARPALGDIPA